MVKITFLGACREIGRSAVLIESEETPARVVCDYGIRMSEKEQNLPGHIRSKDLTAIVLTHAHLDHTGGAPIFYVSSAPRIYATPLTFKLTQILLQDMLKIQGKTANSYIPFTEAEIAKLFRARFDLQYKNRQQVGKDCYITLYNAGHIPGSAMVLVEMDGKNILYTGDINATRTQLLPPHEPPNNLPPLDCVITESSYATTNHPPREELEKNFVNGIKNIRKDGGMVLVPAFGVSRSQEILGILAKYKIKDNIFLDGMARSVAEMFTEFPAYLRDAQEYEKSLKNVHFIAERHGSQERKRALETKGAVIVAPSGMLKGGTARLYAQRCLPDPACGVFLVSYQIEGSPGRSLLEARVYTDDNGKPVKSPVNASVQYFEFSSHAGMDQLHQFVETCAQKNENLRAFCIHGEEKNAVALADYFSSNGIPAEAPSYGDQITV
ncbi:MAG TPA: MBL fold metallo-hydrolase [Candidatus Lokiarchaeia archaeon]|nr:MBL fold metallo-hydrolase [Candidatus Lokiarchaeia archaeon]